jgi:two-component system sensor histidine kinase/response regulator
LKTLEHSGRLDRAIGEAVAEGIWVLDADEATTCVNPQLAALLGYEPAEVVGKPPQFFIDEEPVELVGAELERLRQGIPESEPRSRSAASTRSRSSGRASSST